MWHQANLPGLQEPLPKLHTRGPGTTHPGRGMSQCLATLRSEGRPLYHPSSVSPAPDPLLRPLVVESNWTEEQEVGFGPNSLCPKCPSAFESQFPTA